MRVCYFNNFAFGLSQDECNAQLKYAAACVMLLGTFVGFVFSGGRIDDVNQWISGFSNFVFYSGLAYLALTAWIKMRSNIKNNHH
jgi:hypothetical protein